jgi:hypothetical protein
MFIPPNQKRIANYLPGCCFGTLYKGAATYPDKKLKTNEGKKLPVIVRFLGQMQNWDILKFNRIVKLKFVY